MTFRKRNILAVLIGLVVAYVVHMITGSLYSFAVPPPDGVDIGDPESIAANLKSFEPKHYFSHITSKSLGTFAGAIIAYLIAADHKMKIAMSVGVLYLLYYIIDKVFFPFPVQPPIWVFLVNLVFPYIPMGWLGGNLAKKISSKHVNEPILDDMF